MKGSPRFHRLGSSGDLSGLFRLGSNLFKLDHSPLIDGLADEQPHESCRARLGQCDRRRQRLLGTNRGEKGREGQPRVVLRARMDGLTSALAIAEGERPGAEIKSAVFAQDCAGSSR